MSKKILWFVAIGFLFITGTIGVTIWQLNPILESFRPDLEHLISSKLNHRVSVGKIALSLFPSPVARVSDIRLSEKSETPIVKEILLKIPLLPLLKKRLEISEIGVIGARLQILRRERELLINGISLASFMHPSNTEEKEPSDKKSIAVHIDKMSVKDSEVTFRDETLSPVREISAQHLAIEGHDFVDGAKTRLNASGSLFGEQDDNFLLSGTLENGVASGAITLKKVNAEKISKLLESYSKSPLPGSVTNTTDLSGEFTVSQTGFVFKGTLDAEGTELSFPEKFTKPRGKRLSVEFAGKSDLGNADISALLVSLGNNSFSLPLRISPDGLIRAQIRSAKLLLSDLVNYVPPIVNYQLGGELAIDLDVELLSQALKALSGKLDFHHFSFSLPSSSKPEMPCKSEIDGGVHFAGTSADFSQVAVLLCDQPLTTSGSISTIVSPEAKLAVSAQQIDLSLLAKSFASPSAHSLGESTIRSVTTTGTYSTARKTALIVFETDGGVISGYELGKTKLTIDALFGPEFAVQRLNLQPSNISLFGGNTSINGNLNEDGLITSTLQASGVNLQKLFAVLSPNSKITLTGNLDALTFKGSAEKADPAHTLSGSVETAVTAGSIQGFNLLAQTLGKINDIPGLGAALISFVPEQHRFILQSDSTSFDDLLVYAQLNRGSVKINRLELHHELYALSGNGEMREDGSLDIHAQFKLTEKLSQGMVLKEPRLKLLLDKNNNIVFPVIITRKGAIILVAPDVSNLGKRALENTAKDVATRALDKVTPGLGRTLDSLFK